MTPNRRPLRIFAAVRRVGYRCSRLWRLLSTAAFRASFAAAGHHHSYRQIGDLNAELQTRWAHLEQGVLRLTVVVVTYRQPKPLECLLASLACQTLQNFDVIVLHDGPDPETASVVERFRAREPERFRYVETCTRYNDYGHTLRGLGIEAAGGEFILITNGDNYYAPRFTEFVFEAIDAHSLDFAMWDMVHSHSRPGGTVLASYSPFQVYPVRYMIDIGAFVVRTKFARQVGFMDKTHDGDARYVEDLLALHAKLRIGKVDKTLMVHN